jgi:CDP-glucose 4,6-dehydratase
MTYWLNSLGAQVCGIGLEPNTNPNLYSLLSIANICESNLCDIRDRNCISKIINRFNPSIVFHLAAQPLVRASYHAPVETFETNIMGTVNVLDSLRSLDLDALKSIVLITTDKVYDNREWCWAYRESDQLGGNDPYSASKAACELVANAYRTSFFNHRNIPVSTARAGNVIGGGDWSEDRLIPDMMKSWSVNQPVQIRNPLSIRSWQHVLEPIYGYFRLAELTSESHQLQGAYNFSCSVENTLNVDQIVELAKPYFKDAAVKMNSKDEKYLKESAHLRIDPSKAEMYLGVKSVLSGEKAVEWAMSWYKDFYSGKDAATLCNRQLDAFEILIK